MSKRAIFEEVGAGAARPSAPAPGAAEAARMGARRAIGVWLWVLLAMVAVMVVVGGLTRLTDSGLSITEWNLIMGSLPPMSEAAWREAFTDYQTTDEFKLQNSWMTLADFKPIFWWEWGHRFMGRMIGLVWLLPLLYFAIRGQIPRGWGPRLVLIGFLGGLQGAIGWWMVFSGLSDRVDVAPYRLATHLGLAFLIFAVIAWLILTLRQEEWARLQARRRRAPGMTALTRGVLVLLFLQILLGALVAGTDAGKGWVEWPLMDDRLMPLSAWDMTPAWSNFFENPAMTNFVHRSSAYLVILAAIFLAVRGRRTGHNRTGFWTLAFCLGIFGQALLGIVTLLHAAPVSFSLAHQVAALALLGLGVRTLFETAYPSEQKITA